MVEKREYAVDGILPSLSVSGETIPQAWENAVVKLYEKGIRYSRAGPKDEGKKQTDSTMAITIQRPLSRLFLHKFAQCGWADLLEYQMEILGAKDSWVDPTERSTRWQYHYHERLASYPGGEGHRPIDQLKGIIQKLSTEPFKRNINAVTWVPKRDQKSKDPPCLQRVWFTMIPSEVSPRSSTLNMDYNFRSRNVMIATPMNQVGLATLFCYVADEVMKRTRRKVKIGRMVDFNDSYHVSARDQPLLEGFMEQLRKSRERGETINNRSYTNGFSLPLLEEEREAVEQKILVQTKKILLDEKGKSRSTYYREVEKIMQISETVMQINRSLV